MGEYRFIETESELNNQDFVLDVRPWGTRVADSLTRPEIHARWMIGLAIGSVVFAPIWWLFLVLILVLHLVFISTPQMSPLRYAKDLGGRDPSNIVDPNNPTWGKANGIWYVGTERSLFPWKAGRELWLSDSDIGTHMLTMGTTGSGKTQALLSWNFNALCWGSGFSYTDGKADNELIIKIWTMLRRFGREDDFLIINYLTGGADPFSDKSVKRKRRSNKANMFADAPMDFLSELLTSMLAKAEGDGATWQAKAINMMKAVVRVCCYLRAEGKIEVSVQTLRDHMQLGKLEELYVKGEKGLIPETAFSAIRSYLLTGISWSPDKYKAGKPQANEVQTQHGYLTNQFLAPLSMLADTYGHIFADPFPEVDMGDVMLRRRILVNAIPTLEKSPQEAANLGKLIVGAMKLMMGKNLGSEVEGTYRSTIKNKATNARSRYPITLDELGYYFAPGLDLIFAQARSLKFSMCAAGQDFAAMKKEGGEEVISMIGNSKVKFALALEDPTETFEIYEKAAGQAKVAQSSGSEMIAGSSNWSRLLTSSLQDVARITFRELKQLISGQGIIIFLDKVVRFNAFYIFSDDDRKGWICPAVLDKHGIEFKVNRFLQVYKTDFSDMVGKCKPLDGAKTDKSAQVLQVIYSNTQPIYVIEQDAMIESIKAAAAAIPIRVGPVERGIALFTAAAEVIEREDGLASERAGGSSSGGGLGVRPTAPTPMAGESLPVPTPAPVVTSIDELSASQIESDDDIDPFALMMGEAHPVVEVIRTKAVSEKNEPALEESNDSWLNETVHTIVAKTLAATTSTAVELPNASVSSADVDSFISEAFVPPPDMSEEIGMPPPDQRTEPSEIVFDMTQGVKESVKAIEALTGRKDADESTSTVEKVLSQTISELISKENASIESIEMAFANLEENLDGGH
jgi:intracellular multiplication protein IcmO